MLVGTRFHDDPLARLDDWRDQQPDKPSRPEAIRRLLDVALAVQEQSIRNGTFGSALAAPLLNSPGTETGSYIVRPLTAG